MGSGGRIALGTWIAAALLCGIAMAVIGEASRTYVGTSARGVESTTTTQPGSATPHPTVTVAPVAAAGPEATVAGDATTSSVPEPADQDAEADEPTGGVHLTEPGTWLLRADGATAALLATGAEGAALEWATADRLVRVVGGRELVVVGSDGSTRSAVLDADRTITSFGVGGGRVVFGWSSANGTFGTSAAGLDLAGEHVLLRGENASTIAVGPDGRAFTVAGDGARTFDAAGNPIAGPRAVGAMVFGATWDATGAVVAVEAGNEVVLLGADLAEHGRLSAAGPVTVAPGGDRIAYTASLGPADEVAVFVAAPGEQPRLVADVGGEPAWHPAGATVAYGRYPWPARGRPAGEIRATDPDGGSTVRLASLADGLVAEHPRWSPDGAWLAVDLRFGS